MKKKHKNVIIYYNNYHYVYFLTKKKNNYFRNSQKISNIIYFNQSKMHCEFDFELKVISV